MSAFTSYRKSTDAETTQFTKRSDLDDAMHSTNTNRSLINGATANGAHLNSLRGENVIFKLS